MKILIFISKTTGLECLKFLLQNFRQDDYHIVVSDPDLSLITTYLGDMHIPFFHLDQFKANDSSETYDWLLNLWGGYVFPKSLLEKVKNSLNLHPSLLPHGRGRDPVVWAIKHSHPAGATLHQISSEVDGGDIWFQREVPYTFEERGSEVYERVVKTCIHIFQEKWPLIRTGEVTPFPQASGVYPTMKRKDLLHDRVITLGPEDNDVLRFIKTVQAHDYFPNYTAILGHNDALYEITLNLKRITE